MQYAIPARQGVQQVYQGLEHAFDRAFGGRLNPLKHLGAVAFLLFWLLALSGTVLYVMLDTSAGGAYRSIEEFSRDTASPGSILRGLHRYSADGFIVIAVAHLAREWLLGRFNGFRRFSWLTGVPLLPLAFVCAIGGFWLNWDRLGQYSAVATAEWLDALPFLASPLARNFLGGAVSDRLFSLFVFVHIGVPLLLVFGLWFHIQRIARAEVFPPRALGMGTAVTLLAMALALPVRSQGPADLGVVPGPLALDWWLLFIHPLTAATSAGFVWTLVLAAIAGLFALPFMRPRVPLAVARVDPAHCNGCRRCEDDCPYGAIAMVPHPNGRRGVAAGARGRGPLRELRHLRGRLPFIDAVSQHRAAGDRHRHAAVAHRCAAAPAGSNSWPPRAALPASSSSAATTARASTPWRHATH